MPVTLPKRYRGHRFTLRQTVAFLVLLGRMRLLDCRMGRLSQRSKGRRSARDQARLVAGARRWLALSARISIVSGIPEPPRALEIRAVFAEPVVNPGLGGRPPSI